MSLLTTLDQFGGNCPQAIRNGWWQEQVVHILHVPVATIISKLGPGPLATSLGPPPQHPHCPRHAYARWPSAWDVCCPLSTVPRA